MFRICKKLFIYYFVKMSNKTAVHKQNTGCVYLYRTDLFSFSPPLSLSLSLRPFGVYYFWFHLGPHCAFLLIFTCVQSVGARQSGAGVFSAWLPLQHVGSPQLLCALSRKKKTFPDTNCLEEWSNETPRCNCEVFRLQKCTNPAMKGRRERVLKYERKAWSHGMH